jgi:hypothetical protein
MPFSLVASMDDTLIIQRATEELALRSFGMTEQFLEIHEVVYIDGSPIVARVDTEKPDGTAIVYFPIVDQKFYFAIYLDTAPEVSVRWVGTEPYHSVYFRASTDKLSFQQLAGLTKLTSTRGRNKGDKKNPNGRDEIRWKKSTIDFEPNPEADEFEDKLTKLLIFLEQDQEGVENLVNKANGYIQVYSSFHNGNTLVGGHHIELDHIKRMSKLNLEIDFDISADGKFFK